MADGLGILGIGIDTAIASADEIGNEILKEKKIDATKVKALEKAIENRGIKTEAVNDVLTRYGYEKIADISVGDYIKVCDEISKFGSYEPILRR